MLISIHHRTSYRYDRPFNHAIQALRLTPPTGESQIIRSWTISCPGIERAAEYQDAFGNVVHLVTPPGETDGLEIEASGVIEPSIVPVLSAHSMKPCRLQFFFAPQRRPSSHLLLPLSLYNAAVQHVLIRFTRFSHRSMRP